jgi:hypothetical protein
MKKSSLYFLALLLFSTSALASEVYVERATGTGVSDSDLSSIADLVSSSLPAQGASITAEKSKASIVLRPKLLKLGQAYIVTLERVEDGEITYSAQLKAARAEELDTVCSRLTRAVMLKKPPAGDVRVGEVTEQEAKAGMERKPARRMTLLGFGPAWMNNLGTSGMGYYFEGAYGWDVNKALVKIDAGIALNSSAFFSHAGLSGNLFLTDQDISPYVAADAGFGFSKSAGNGVLSGETTAGFLVGGGAGVTFLRTSSINLELGFRIDTILNTNSAGNPLMYGAHLGFYF